jgi:hypothetical protein
MEYIASGSPACNLPSVNEATLLRCCGKRKVLAKQYTRDKKWLDYDTVKHFDVTTASVPTFWRWASCWLSYA